MTQNGAKNAVATPDTSVCLAPGFPQADCQSQEATKSESRVGLSRIAQVRVASAAGACLAVLGLSFAAFEVLAGVHATLEFKG
jgi:hypothetical protein